MAGAVVRMNQRDFSRGWNQFRFVSRELKAKAQTDQIIKALVSIADGGDIAPSESLRAQVGGLTQASPGDGGWAGTEVTA